MEIKVINYSLLSFKINTKKSKYFHVTNKRILITYTINITTLEILFIIIIIIIIIIRGAWGSLLLTQYCAGGKIEKNEMGGAGGANEGGERCAQGSSGET